MKKYETLNEIMKIYDENERLKRENSELLVAVNSFGKPTPVKIESDIEKIIMEYGIEAAIKKFERYSFHRKVELHENDEGMKIAKSFDKWYADYIDESKFPGSISKDEFKRFLLPHLKNVYEDELESSWKEEKGGNE